ncbi:MAG: ATP-binding protein, partial [Alphaproteobacteria bacterium]
ADLIETVIENVIDNAIEMAPHGSELEVELKRDADWAGLAVRDRGPGVAEGDQERIFERYVSLRQAAAAERPAGAAGDGQAVGPHLGIGLWIVRRNLQALGGEIWAENRKGGGLAVNMGLPLAR